MPRPPRPRPTPTSSARRPTPAPPPRSRPDASGPRRPTAREQEKPGHARLFQWAMSKPPGQDRRAGRTSLNFHPTEENDMRFMVLVKATRQSEAAEMPSTELMAEM